MNFNTPQANQVISSATKTLLFDTDYHNLTAALKQLHQIFAAFTGIRAGDITDDDINLPSGKAVSTIKAAHCLLEIDRTRKFLRGIYQAINQFLDKQPDQPVNILYAGCGPYATLLTPLTTLFTSQQVRFTMLDINAASLEAAHLLYRELGILDYVMDFVCTDATSYQLPANVRYDMIISETMLNALRKEPQLAIMNNLVPQLHPEAIFIPETITVEAMLTRWEEEYNYFVIPDYEPKRIKAGLVYCASREFLLPKPVVIHAPASETHNRLDLFTEINVFGGEILTTYNCSLTMPLAICKLENHQKDVAVTFEYVMSDHPGFSHTF